MSDQWPVGDVDELVDEQSADMRLVLPVDVASELAAGIGRVLESASVHAAPLSTQADWVATFVAPELAARDATIADLRAQLEDAGLQVQQAGKALAESMAASVAVAGHHVWLKGVAYRRHCSAQRLREELEAALVDADRFRALREQSCPRGLHDGWFVASEHHYVCPWCMVNDLREATPKAAGLADHLRRLAEALGIDSAEEDINPYAAVEDLQLEVNRIRDEVVSQPGYADRHRGCVTIGGGYCVDVHAEDDLEDEGKEPDDRDPDDVSVDVPPRPAFLASECPAHGPHPHAQLKCLDCPQCADGAR